MPLGIGIIGCGNITRQRHAPEYSSNKDCEIAAFCDPVQERAAELSARYGGRIYTSYKALLSDERVEAISVCSANHTHAEIAIEALYMGKHVLCEKPMATGSAQAMAMIEAQKASGKVLMIAHNQRFFPAHIMAKNILEKGELGRVISFRTTFKHSGPEYWTIDKASNWFFDKAKASFGVLGDLGIHKIDLISYLLSDKIVNVSARMATLHKEGATVEDNAFCIFQTQKGVMGSMEVSWSNYGSEENNTVIYCEKGTMSLCSDPEHGLIITMPDGKKSCHQVGGASTNDEQIPSGVINAFIHSILESEPVLISGQDGYDGLRVLEACVLSSKTEKMQYVCI